MNKAIEDLKKLPISNRLLRKTHKILVETTGYQRNRVFEFSEDRFIILGFSIKLRILVVCHCYREDDSIIRIISARISVPIHVCLKYVIPYPV
jgi:uncharacterized DUF497 family protein